MDENTINFSTLKKSGVEHIQAASRDIWTDYNLHDPGITILEQFCFALTEVAYRAESSIEHHLLGENGQIDLQKAGLLSFEQAFSCPAVTRRDLTELISSSSDAYERVMIDSVAAPEISGLYTIHIVSNTRPTHINDCETSQDDIKNTVSTLFMQNRNLCEDVDDIIIAEKLDCRLKVKVEVRRGDLPALTAALIYNQCKELMTRRSAMASVREKSENSTNTYGANGSKSEQLSQDSGLFLSMFFSTLMELDEVRSVNALSISLSEKLGQNPFVEAEKPGKYLDLHIPNSVDDIVLTSEGIEIPYDLKDMQGEVYHLKIHKERKNKPTTATDTLSILNEEKTPRKSPFNYQSIGEILPPAYYAGREFLPQSASVELRAHNTQLRGLLYLSDLLLLNAHSDISALSTLFSNSSLDSENYSAKIPVLDAPITKLIPSSKKVETALSSFGNAQDRKGRVLNYLLGLQAEHFTQNSLQRYNYYESAPAQQRTILRNRQELLSKCNVLNYNRSAGANLLAGEHGHNAGFGEKLAILLDIPARESRRVSLTFESYGLAFTKRNQSLWGEADNFPAPDNLFDVIVPRLESELIQDCSYDALMSDTSFLDDRIIGANHFRRGVSNDAYVLYPHADGTWELLFDSGEPDAVYHCAIFDSKGGAIMHANQLREFLVTLNKESEGFYILEDIMLRDADGTFDPMSVTVVFSGWSARFFSPGFIALAEETIRNICPAHINVKIIWLNYHDMGWFENLYYDWHHSFQHRKSDVGECAKKIRFFLSELTNEVMRSSADPIEERCSDE